MENKYMELIAELNLTYFSILKLAAQEGNEIAMKLLGLDFNLMSQLATTETKVLERLASVGVPLFRVYQPDHLTRSIRLVEKGHEQQAKALITMRAIAGAGGGEHGG
jgi:hypothetical protein